MSRSFSISEAKDQLPRLVRDAETGQVVRLTRRGEPVAVLLSAEAYERLRTDEADFWRRLDDFRQRHHLDEEGVEPEEWLGGIREAAAGREFTW